MTKNIKKLPLILKKWIDFWMRKWSIIIKDYTKIIKDLDKLENLENLFISINWYQKWSKNRQEENINKLNCFFYDIDIKDNPHLTKEEIIEKIMENKDLFDFWIETKNGVHLYQLLEENIYIDKNNKLDIKKYLEDWKIKLEKYEYEFWINFDKNCIKTTQISRIPWSIHAKPNQDKFEIKLLFWENLLNWENSKDLINKVPIIQVLEKLWYEYDTSEYSIIVNWEKTSWWKINIKENYVNDFSKLRPNWEPFSFVLKHFNLKNWKKDLNYGLTYKFFEESFWIISKAKKEKYIKINKLISINLLKSSLSQENIQYFLLLSYFATKNNILDWIESWLISINEIKNFIWNEKIKKTTIINNLKDLDQNSFIKINTKLKLKNWSYLDSLKIIDIKFKKENWIKINFIIFPWYIDLIKQLYDSRFFHYMNKNIINLKVNNNKLVYFYLFLHKKMILWKKDELFLSNNEIDDYQINKNLSLRNKKLNEFWKILWDFEFIKKWDEGFLIRKI